MINIYWSPYFTVLPMEPNMEIFYGDIEPAKQEFLEHKNQLLDNSNDNFLVCPSFNDIWKNTYLFRNMVEGYARVENGQVHGKLDHDQISFNIVRKNTLDNRQLLKYEMSWLLFADKPLNMRISSPFFHTAEHTAFGSIVPGAFDIGQWYRPITLEFCLQPNTNEIYIPANDPLVYMTFETDEKLNIQRYELTTKLIKYAVSTMRTRPTGSFSPLKKSYSYWNRTHLRGLILKEIKANLLYPTK
jgi:hypothetical protein